MLAILVVVVALVGWASAEMLLTLEIPEVVLIFTVSLFILSILVVDITGQPYFNDASIVTNF